MGELESLCASVTGPVGMCRLVGRTKRVAPVHDQGKRVERSWIGNRTGEGCGPIFLDGWYRIELNGRCNVCERSTEVFATASVPPSSSVTVATLIVYVSWSVLGGIVVEVLMGELVRLRVASDAERA